MKHIKKLIGTFVLLFCAMAANAQFSDGDGSENNPYVITTVEELAQLATYVNTGNTNYNNKCYKLGNDIDLTEYLSETGAGYNDGKGWMPIGYSNNMPFQGFFDGNNQKIFGIRIDNSTIKIAGLFGCILTATVKNLGVENMDIKAGNFLGGIVGSSESSNIINCYSTGSLSKNYPSSSWSGTGGIAGFNNGNIFHCNSSASIICMDTKSSQVGGIVGENYGTVSNCSFTGSIINISNNCDTGGIVGSHGYGTISNCFSSGTVKGANNNSSLSEVYTGGIVGLCWGDGVGIIHCYSIGSVSSSGFYDPAGGVAGRLGGEYSIISNCYSTGTVSSKNTFAGGIAGITDSYKVKILNCYSISKVIDAKRVGGIVGRNDMGIISNCVALNPELTGGLNSSAYYGRIVGIFDYEYTQLNLNIAYEDMINPEGNTIWNNTGFSNKDGESISCEEIIADGTFGGRFTSEGGWTTQHGKLPGLFGSVVTFPEHLLLCGYPPIITTITLPDDTVGFEYSYTLTADGNIPIIWLIEIGNLPDGLFLTEGGEISGTPTIDGIFNFTVKAKNDFGYDTKEFSITVYKQTCEPVNDLTLEKLDDKTISLSWSEPESSLEVEGYAVFRNSLLQNIVLLTDTVYVDENLSSGAYEYYVVAHFTNGCVSDSSNHVRESVSVGRKEKGEGRKEEVKVYPNPAFTTVTIEANIFSKVEIYNVFGQLLNISMEKIVDISTLNSGVYFLKIYTEKEMIVKKVIKN